MKTLIILIGRSVLMSGGLLLGLSVAAAAGTLEFRPSIAIGEEVTDNIYEDPDDKRTEYTTLVTPGFNSKYESSLWRWDAAYTLVYKHFARNSGVDEYNNNADLKGNITLLDNFFYLDVTERYQQIYTDIARDQSTQSSLNLDQTKQNTATVSPYLLWRLSEKNTLKTGYRFTDTRYWGEGEDKTQHDLFVDFTHELSAMLSISAGYKLSFEQIDADGQLTSDRITTNEAYGGFRYAYADKSSIFGTIGNSWQKFSDSGSTTFVTWKAGIIHDFGTLMATLETSSQTTEDPLTASTTETIYRIKLDQELTRGALSFSGTYSKYDYTESNEDDERKLAFTGSGRYEVVQGLTPNFSVTAEHYDQGVSFGSSAIEYPYHLSATAGLSYAFNNDLTLRLYYFYDSYRFDLNETAAATDINRLLLEVKKNF